MTPETIGRYRILGKLGQGGMGAVYDALDPTLGRRVAIKLMQLDAEPTPQDLQRFQTEAQALAQLQHPGVVGVLELGQHRGQPFLVMHKIEGESLKDRVRREGPLPAREAATLTRDLARALAHAHGRHILHRDIKPANVLLDGEGRALLTDFGLARFVTNTQRLTQTGTLLGTPAYMSPEQSEGEAEPRSDVYSLGATLYVMLTGSPPFTGATALNIITAVLSTPPRSPVSLRPETDPLLSELCMRCLAKDPQDRFESATAMAEALDDYLAGVSARGSRAPVVLAGLALLLVAAVLLVASFVGPPEPAPRPEDAPAPSKGASTELGPARQAAGEAAERQTWLSVPRWEFEHPGKCAALALLNDGRALTAGEGWVVLWDLQRREEVRRWTWPFKGTVQTLAVAPDGSRFAFAGGQKGSRERALVLIGNLADPQAEAEQRGPIFELPTVNRLAWAPDEDLLLAAHYDFRYLVSLTSLPRTWDLWRDNVNVLTTSANSQVLVSVWKPTAPRLFAHPLPALDAEPALELQPVDQVWEMSSAGNGTALLCMPNPPRSTRVQVVRARAGRLDLLRTIPPLSSPPLDFRGFDVAYTGDRVFLSSAEGLWAWRTDTGEPLLEGAGGPAGPLSAAQDGRGVLTSAGERVAWWDLSGLDD